MNLYYVNYPRDFANEYTVFAVPSEMRERFEVAYPDADRITRVSAIERGIRRPAEACRDGEQWFGGLCDYGPSSDARTDAGKLAHCADCTVRALDEAESYA